MSEGQSPPSSPLLPAKSPNRRLLTHQQQQGQSPLPRGAGHQEVGKGSGNSEDLQAVAFLPPDFPQDMLRPATPVPVSEPGTRERGGSEQVSGVRFRGGPSLVRSAVVPPATLAGVMKGGEGTGADTLRAVNRSASS
mmetsp:Transcript_7074/g.19975  ORF Transcript_7074/g.19975 Transcript_7074/m.19975 type:complete len:137 (+) Transcript_7074:104-514(+)